MSNLLDHIEAISLYVETGCPPGSCTTAILANDLRDACGRADATTRYILFDIVKYCHNHVPRDAWGSPEKVYAWMEHGGLRGLERRAREQA